MGCVRLNGLRDPVFAPAGFRVDENDLYILDYWIEPRILPEEEAERLEMACRATSRD